MLLYFLWGGFSAFAAYRTPDTGTTYTLASLVPLSGGAVQQIPSGYLLTDKITISPTDALEILDEFLYINPWSIDTPEVFSSIIIEGRLKAENSHFLPAEEPENEKIMPNCRGIFINDSGGVGNADATVTSCTFQMFKVAISSRSGQLFVQRSRFENCDSGAVYLYSKAMGTLTDCLFLKAFVVISDSTILMEGCRFEEGNISLSNVSDESVIKNCEMTGSWNAALDIIGNTNARIQDNVFTLGDYGVSISDRSSSSTAVLEGNIISRNRQGALTVEGTAQPRLRKNKILHNALNPPYYSNPVILPAILVSKSSNPDFGTFGEPGENIIRYNSPVAFYHAGDNVVQAIGNDWGIPNASQAEDFIYHLPDDYEDGDQSGFLSGLVVFTPVSYLRLYTEQGNSFIFR
jgi:hypothetical protein